MLLGASCSYSEAHFYRMWLILLVHTQKRISSQKHVSTHVNASSATEHLSMEHLLLRHKDDPQRAV